MKFKKEIGLLATGLTALGMTSCLKPETFPAEPEIEFRSFEISGDSARLTIYFTDGDGNVGLRDEDTTAPFDVATGFYNNLFTEYWEKDDQLGWVQGTNNIGKPIEVNFRVPYLTPDGKNKALKGEIEVTFEPDVGYFNPFSSESDTIMYKIKLVDRALNISNQVSTGEIYRE